MIRAFLTFRRVLAATAAATLWVSMIRPPPRFTGQAEVASIRVTDRSGGTLYEYRPEGIALPVPADRVPAVVARALVATEDRRFPWHPGVDAWAVIRAAVANARAASVVSGASTLAMQVARMRRGGRSDWLSKLSDARTAILLTAWHGRAAVLHEWLSRAYFGRNAYGIEAAGRAWFGKPASDLSLPEAAFLVGLPQTPSARSRDPGGRAPFRRQRVVLGAMVEAGYLSLPEAESAAALPLAIVEPDPVPMHALHVAIPEARQAALRSGVEVRTTLDRPIQTAVEELARGHVASLSQRGVGQVAAVVVDNATGDVLAWLGSADYGDARSGGANDGVTMLRQPGSALKPFAYAEAFARRAITPATILADIETGMVEEGAAFSAENYDRRFHGPVPARRALAASYNVPAVRLARRLGPDRVLDRLHAFGFLSLDRPAAHYGVGIVLGNGEVRLLELARAYAALARGGSLPGVRRVAWVRTARGDTLRAPSGQAMPTGIGPAEAFLVTDILADPAARAPAFGRGSPLELPFATAAKTGTSKDYRDNWAVGYTPAVTVAVWAGNFDGAPMRDVSGVTGAGTLMRAVLEVIGPGGTFDPPGGVERARVCPQSGKRPGAWCPGVVTEWFLGGGSPRDTCDVHRLVAVDRVTGYLADASSRDVEYRRLTAHPDEFREWMVANGLPLMPAARPAPGAPGEPAQHAGFRVLRPEDGTVLQVDPVLRGEYQRLHLKAGVPGSLYDLHWLVDGVRLEAPFDSAAWRLVPGRHRIEARGRAADGRWLRSRAVTVTVHGIES